ncbi:MAG: ATP-binding cassette domain-containing protein [Methanoregula sp.]|jgi:ABC-type sulfate/molybdate transport systems ATPase subunit|nr:ATP-binding cassette domain-containing protein [Methanoregula sp.]
MLEASLHKQLRDFSLDLNIQVNTGEILVLMGENGAGKSTVLNILSGILNPDSGSIRLNGWDLFQSASGICVPVESRRIGYVLQNSAVFPHLSVSENVAYGMKARHLQKNLIGEQVDHWMGLMDIQNLADVKAGNLSGGQKQRVALARALATRPALLMLDEPFTALDIQSTVSVKDAIRKCVVDLQIPSLVVTHRIADAHDMGDRICILSRGTNIWEGSPSDMSNGKIHLSA